MKTLNHWLLKCTPAGLLLLFSGNVQAARLQVADDASLIWHIGAAFLLYFHIGTGAIGIVSGIAASLSRKGRTLHRIAGKVFYFSMFGCYATGAAVAPFLEAERLTNFVAGILALYLLMSGVSAANRRVFEAALFEKIGLAVALCITAMGGVFIYLGSQSPTGTVDGAPPQAFYLFVVAGFIAAIGEINVIVRKQLSATGRLVRHVWRMCMSFFIASGSLFFGQAKFFPDWFNASLLPLLFGLFPFFILIVGVIQTLKPLKYLKQRFWLKTGA